MDFAQTFRITIFYDGYLYYRCDLHFRPLYDIFPFPPTSTELKNDLFRYVAGIRLDGLG